MSRPGKLFIDELGRDCLDLPAHISDSNGPSRRRSDRGREGWGLWMYREGITQPADPRSRTKSGTIVPKHNVLRYSVQIAILVVSWRLIRKE